jgi:HPr kinase/phosphorylase
MPERFPSHDPKITVREFCGTPDLGIDIELLAAAEGLDNEIRSPRIQKLGLGLAGFPGYIHPDRVQVMGGSELNYLNALGAEARAAAYDKLRGVGICAVVVTKGLDPPEGFLDLARSEGIPVLRTTKLSSLAVARITGFLEDRLAPIETVHGVLLEIFGLGVLLIGPSGIGKSECALELVLKGHGLIADDSVEIRRIGIDRLIGSGGAVLQHHIEVRGIGIINIKELFGISATRRSQPLDLAVRLERWRSETEYDRLGLDQPAIDFLGVSIPLIEMPVAPGRNVSTLVEVAARVQLMRLRGHDPAKDVRDPSITKNGNS